MAQDPRISALQQQNPEETLNIIGATDQDILSIGFSVDQFLRRFDALAQERTNLTNHWQEIAQVISPQKAVFNETHSSINKPQLRNNSLYDTTGAHSNELLSSGFFSLLTSPTMPWFDLRTNIEALNNQYDVNVWLHEISRILAYEIQKPDTGFTSASHEFYLEYGSYGNATMFVTEPPSRDGLVFLALPLAECHYQENDNGRVDTLYRRYWRTPYQLINRFGEARVHAKVREAYLDPQQNKRFEIIHAILPNQYAEALALSSRELPYLSVYVDKENKHVLSISGFNEQPFMAARFYKMPSEVYGFGPGSIALADLNMLQEMMKTTLRGAQKMVDPPLMMPDAGFLTPPNTAPGRVNYFRAGSAETDRIIPLQTFGHPEIGMDMIQNVQNRIREIFFVDQLQLNIGPQMTATEVMQRTEEKQRLMGPVTGRASTEFLSPLLFRSFNILARQGKIPPPPTAILEANAQFRIVYTSPIFKAQEQVQANNLMRLQQTVVGLLANNPEMLAMFHPERTLEIVGEMFNIDKRMFRTPQEMEALRQQQAQMQEQMQQAAMLRDTGVGIRNLAQAGTQMGGGMQ